MLTSDMSLQDADKWAMRKAFFKKFEDVTHRDASKRAIEAFINDNARCHSFSLQPKSWFDEYVIGEVTSLLDSWLHDSDGCPATLTTLTDMSRCGPGSSVDVDLPAFFTKLFDSSLSCANPTLRQLYSTVISSNPTWARAEEWRSSLHGWQTVRGSTLSTVRKQFDIDRTIATEPVLEMFFQLGIGGFLESGPLSRLGINLATQPDKNREMARLGSLNQSFGTIDLKSASNSIANGLLELFPRYFRNWLLRARSPFTRLPSGEWLELHMVASMGNGYCFPLQTMLFASIVVAVYRLMEIRVDFGSARPEGFLSPLYGGDRITCGVFGDDIVVRREAYDTVCRALRLFGFIVNDEKSFNSGPFRESCGKDYFVGSNIRGVYVKTLASKRDCYSLINRLTRWTAKTGIPLNFTIAYLLRTVGFHPIPFQDGDDEGVKVPSTWWLSRYRVRKETAESNNSGELYWSVSYRANGVKIPSSWDEVGNDEVRGYSPSFNEPGILVSLIAGYIRGGKITIRDEEESSLADAYPKVRLRSVPFWDYVSAEACHELRGNSWEASTAAVMALALPFMAPGNET